MMEEQVKEIASRLKEFFKYNKMLRDKYHLMVLYSMPYDEQQHLEAQEECVKKMMPDVKFIPLEESDSIFSQIPETEESSSMKAYFDSMKAMITWCKTDKKYLEAMTRANLLCLVYEQIHSLIAMHYSHVIDPLLALEEKLYAPMPVDRNAFAEKLIQTMEFYREPKEKWPAEKEGIYCLLGFFTDVQEELGCYDLMELRQKVLSMPLTDDSPELARIQMKLSGPITAESFKKLFVSEAFIRAYELNHMYAILDALAEKWMREEMREVLKEENQIFTMPVQWLGNFMKQMEQKYLEE